MASLGSDPRPLALEPQTGQAPALSLGSLLLKTDYWGPFHKVCEKVLIPSDDWATFRTSTNASTLQTVWTLEKTSRRV